MFRIKIAGVIVEIDNSFDCVKTQCKAYTIECGTPDIYVSATDEDIRAYRAATPFFVGMSDGEIESRVIYQKICEQMPAHGAYLFHASVVMMDGRGYAFSAARGVGKTTHSTLWQTYFGADRATIINGDKPLVRREPTGCFVVYGTPWCGKEGRNANVCVPLSAICFIEQAQENSMVPCDTADAVTRLLFSTTMPQDASMQTHMATLIGATVRAVPAFVLRCRPDEEAVKVAYETLSNA